MKNFATAAAETLESLMHQLEERFGDDAELDLEDGVLRAEFDNGVYLINRHMPLQQLWLSSPKSGAWHFAPAYFNDTKSADWLSTRGEKISIYDLLNKELKPAEAFCK